MVNSSPFDREHPSSGILEWESLESRDRCETNSELPDLSPAPSPNDDDQQLLSSQMTRSVLTEQQAIDGDIQAIGSNLQLWQQQISASQADNWIEQNLAELAQIDPFSRGESLLQELRTTRDCLFDSQSELRSLQALNQAQIDTVEHKVLEVKQIKFRIQQIARHSNNQLEKVRGMLASLEQVRQEIVTGLERFGGYEQIQSMLGELEATRYALVIAHDRLKTGQEAFYESLQAIKDESSALSLDSEQKLQQYHQSIDHLVRSLDEDRRQIAVMAGDMALQVTEISELKSQITTMHGQMEEKSHALHAKIRDITEGFAELSQSVQTEKEQFYQLTVETIDKAEAIRSQLAEIAKQITYDRLIVENLTTDIESVRKTLDSESIQQLNLFAQRSKEMMSTWVDIQNRQKNLAFRYGRISLWLWIITFGLGVLIVMFVAILMKMN